MTRNCLAFSLAFLVGICFVRAARADAVPPEIFACSPGSVGSPCTFNGPGTCQNATCTGIDKSNWDRDSGAAPPTYTYSCLTCVPTGDSSGCAIGGRLARTVGPWLAAGLFGAAIVLARRRPRR